MSVQKMKYYLVGQYLQVLNLYVIIQLINLNFKLNSIKMNNKKITNIYISMKRKELFMIMIIFVILLTFYWIILSNTSMSASWNYASVNRGV